MLTLADALSERFPTGDSWTATAAASLGIPPEQQLQVSDVSAGWIRSVTDAGDVPMLFVLLSDRIGCGHASAMPNQPQWIPLSGITALEAVDETHTPLGTVDVHLGSVVLTVGWAPAFCAAVVDALSHQDRSTVVVDPSSLDDLAPSDWTEPPVASVASPPPPPAWAVPAAGPTSAATEPEAASAPATSAPAPSPAPVDGPAGPWLSPSMVWPDSLRGVAYVGGHPAHPRRRKNGSLTFTPQGWVIEGGGFSSWRVDGGWHEIEHMSVQNAEELEFCEGLKIDAASSALSLQLVDGSQLVVEVRMRRPPSLRATLAPVLLMVEAIPTWRAEWERQTGSK